MRLEAEARTGLCGESKLLRGPCRPQRRIPLHFRRCERAERIGIGGMAREQLTLQVRGEFGDLDAVTPERGAESSQ